MSIFIHKDSRVVVQGVTGKEGAFWAKHMKDMGTQVVFGVTPGTYKGLLPLDRSGPVWDSAQYFARHASVDRLSGALSTAPVRFLDKEQAYIGPGCRWAAAPSFSPAPSCGGIPSSASAVRLAPTP